jgi:uncharacterized protein YjiS (DUF1127 family)
VNSKSPRLRENSQKRQEANVAKAMTITTSVLDVRTLISAVGRGLTHAIRTVQMSRMMSVLSQMSDEQLKQIRITRQEIPSNAEELIYEQH